MDMMSDRKLLEFAAKEAGLITPRYYEQSAQSDRPSCILHDTNEGTQEWNPLIDNGDTFTLMVKSGFGDVKLAVGELVLKMADLPPRGDEEARKAFIRRAVVYSVATRSSKK